MKEIKKILHPHTAERKGWWSECFRKSEKKVDPQGEWKEKLWGGSGLSNRFCKTNGILYLSQGGKNARSPTQGEGKSGEEHTGESLCLRREDFSGEPLGHSGIS